MSYLHIAEVKWGIKYRVAHTLSSSWTNSSERLARAPNEFPHRYVHGSFAERCIKRPEWRFQTP